jgi:ThiF family protein
MTRSFDRNERFFGKEGQEKIASTHVALVGVGGLGTHVAQQLALLGVGELGLIDSEELDATNLNRYVGARYDDPIPGTPKVDIGERLIKSISPDIQVTKVFDSLVSQKAYDEIAKSACVFGCLDSEGARLILNEICAAYNKRYIDLASDITPDDTLKYGGRVFVEWDGVGCLVCCDEIDIVEAQLDLAGPEGKRTRAAIYGLDPTLLDRVGPSVVSINGVVASLGVTEFMVAVTGTRAPKRLLYYYGHTGKVVLSMTDPLGDCYYCGHIRTNGDTSGITQYLRTEVGKFLR